MLPFNPATMLAPMEGVTTPPFRRMIVDNGGLGVACTEFLRIIDAPPSVKILEEAVERAPGALLSVQVMGREAARMEEAARIVSDAGADIVDINLGCPSPKAAKGGVGAAMLRDRATLFAVVSGMRRAVPGVLSAKMRAGFDSADEVVDNARTLVDAGVDFLVVHPRRRVDFYQGVADWRIIKILVDALPIPVIGNGDIWTARDALRMRRETGCAGVMMGRPAMRNPWIFAQLDALERGVEPMAPSGTDVIHAVERFVSIFTESMNRVPIGRLKEFSKWMATAVPDGGVFRKTMLLENTVEGIVGRFHEAMSSLSADELDFDVDGRYRLQRSGSALPAVEESHRAVDDSVVCRVGPSSSP